jgi:uncharacterized protein (TIGR03084 family)
MTGDVLGSLLQDLAAESGLIEDLLMGLEASDWELATSAPGWAIRDQVSHLAFFDQAAVSAATQPDQFRVDAAELLSLGACFPDIVAERYRSMPSVELRTWFRAARTDLLEVFAELDGKARVPWFGPDMSVTSSATARLMETWAHGQDVGDTFRVRPVPTARLRHIAHLGVRTLGFSFALNHRPVPASPVRVELSAPDGGTWAWGDEGADNSVTGPALDFCHLVTQRRHLDDTALVVNGPVATEWMSIAQAFAGAPGRGRQPHPRDERHQS